MKRFLFNLLFPKICLGCGREEEYLCQDCKAVLEISGIHQKYKTNYLSDLYFAIDYKKPLIKKMIQYFKCEPFIKELAKPISSLIIDHFQLLDNKPDFSNFILIPIPLEKRALKWRGFNQAEELAREISRFLNLGVSSDVLIKIRRTPPQVELKPAERKENVKNVFSVKNEGKIKGKRILLIDDVYTTGSTMEEAARVLKKSGTSEIVGLAVAREKPEGDFS